MKNWRLIDMTSPLTGKKDWIPTKPAPKKKAASKKKAAKKRNR